LSRGSVGKMPVKTVCCVVSRLSNLTTSVQLKQLRVQLANIQPALLEHWPLLCIPSQSAVF